MPRREDVRIRATNVANLNIAVTCISPEQSHKKSPVIVMGHGFGAVKAGGLFPSAERFAVAGYVAVMFDYLHFGDSDGTPRNLLSISRELQDFRDVIGWARRQTEMWGTTRIIAWGASFGGMHITALMAEDHDLVAGIMQGPCVDGFAASMQVPVLKTLRILPLAVADRILSLFSSKAIYIPIVGDGKRGSPVAMMSGSQAMEGWRRLNKGLVQAFVNKVTARTILTIPFSRPYRRIRRSSKPLLVIVTSWDNEAPLHKAEQVVRLLSLAEGFRVPGGHFDVYEGGVGFEDNMTRQLQFLRKVLT
ncbi:Alpha/Beta hydrolase protein [Aspergillus granulosus]|uniref:Alpha/Beta hydrolase protein n=1 Tax=Aspergillus granulosus TaxID=176169 RepID=A0ABR4GXU5_9EURO